METIELNSRKKVTMPKSSVPIATRVGAEKRFQVASGCRDHGIARFWVTMWSVSVVGCSRDVSPQYIK